MAKTAASFNDLVKNAPAASAPAPIRATGAVSQGPDAEHFVLTLSTGEQVTLPIVAVTDHETMGGAFGQTLVSVTLDPAHVPSSSSITLQRNADPLLSGTAWDRKPPRSDYHPQEVSAIGGTMPFALGTPHQADAQTIAQMKAMDAAAYAPSGAFAKHPAYDKTPRQDGTYPTPYGLHLDN